MASIVLVFGPFVYPVRLVKVTLGYFISTQGT